VQRRRNQRRGRLVGDAAALLDGGSDLGVATIQAVFGVDLDRRDLGFLDLDGLRSLVSGQRLAHINQSSRFIHMFAHWR